MSDLKYHFEIGGNKYSVPFLKDSPIGVLRKARKAGNDMDAAFTILELILGEDSPEIAAVDTMTPEQFGEWMKGWTQGASLGESSGSES